VSSLAERHGAVEQGAPGGFDRQAGQRVEDAYRKMAARGEYTDAFHAPRYP
jgi:hypothetical protein